VGKVQATVLNPPASFIGQKKGLNVLAGVAKLGLAFQNTGVATSARFYVSINHRRVGFFKVTFCDLKDRSLRFLPAKTFCCPGISSIS